MLVKPDQGVVHELMWWDSFLKAWKGNAIMGTDASYQVYSDASDYGYEGYLAENGKVAKRLVQGFWLPEERGASINTRELWAAERVLAAYGKWKNLQGVTIQLFVDNQVAVSYLRKMGGRFGHLRDIVERIWQRCEERNIIWRWNFWRERKTAWRTVCLGSSSTRQSGS